MNYDGPLFGKIGRRYIPLILSSRDVDEMERKLNEQTQLADGRMFLLNAQEARHKRDAEILKNLRDIVTTDQETKQQFCDRVIKILNP